MIFYLHYTIIFTQQQWSHRLNQQGVHVIALSNPLHKLTNIIYRWSSILQSFLLWQIMAAASEILSMSMEVPCSASIPWMHASPQLWPHRCYYSCSSFTCYSDNVHHIEYWSGLIINNPWSIFLWAIPSTILFFHAILYQPPTLGKFTYAICVTLTLPPYVSCWHYHHIHVSRWHYHHIHVSRWHYHHMCHADTNHHTTK